MAAITYSRQGDYLLPNLTIPEGEEVHLGKYAYLRKQYLMKNRYGMYLNLLTAGTLNQHLLQTEEEAQMRMETLILQMAEKEGVTEELKARDQMEWIGRMNNIRRRAKEIVRNEILEN
ncbi:TnpV protein [Coprococcus comes]|uniref:TnpV protein n=2 Tax=Lachnospiraceae TaxID=186803 RepID=UPI0009EE639E|nr:TnpV protein [Coprococcus comes]MCB7328248.1 TnpV protein [Mediterraneibacter faecis]